MPRVALVVALTLASSVAASLLPQGHERSRPPQLQHASRQQLPRRSLFGLGTAAAVAAAFPGTVQPAAAAGNPLPLPPAAVVLQVADNTIAMQGMMIQSVKDMDDLTEQQRKDVGHAAQGSNPRLVETPARSSTHTCEPWLEQAMATHRARRAEAERGRATEELEAGELPQGRRRGGRLLRGQV